MADDYVDNPVRMDLVMRMLLIMFTVAILQGGCSYINYKAGLSDDWAGEEILEEIIEAKTGVDIDLTPGSREGV